MNMRHLPYLLLIFIFISCARQTQTGAKLAQADSILSNGLPDSGWQALQHIDTTNMNKEDRAYYFLLETYALKMMKKKIRHTHIDASIGYYKQNPSKETFLGRAYLYKSNLFSLENINDSAILYLKKAEHIALAQKDKFLLTHTYIDLAYVNAGSDNLLSAITYAKKAADILEADNNTRLLALVYNQLATFYYRQGNNELSSYYTEKEIPYIKCRPLNEQPYLYNNVATYYYRKKDYPKELFYLKQGLQKCPAPILYGHMAIYYLNNGMLDKAAPLWGKAMAVKDPYCKLAFLKSYAEWYQKQGNLKRYGEVNKDIIQLKDSLQRAQRAEEIKGIQDDFERNEAETAMQSHISALAVTLLATVGALCLAVLVFVWRHRRIRNKLEQTSAQAEDAAKRAEHVTKQAEELRQESQSRKRAIKQMERKMEREREEHQALLSLGRQHYEEVVAGQKVLLWHKQDFVAFLEYYATINHGFMQQIDGNYTGLSVAHRFYLCLKAMQKSDEEVQDIMGLKPGALRTMRYRIGQKERGAQERPQ